MGKLWRQGDVLFAAVEALPAGAVPRDGALLVKGEVTGHAHRVEVPASARLWELDGVLYMEVVAPTAHVVHEEHHPLTFDKGVYRVWQQREYQPKAAPRPVID